MARLKGWKGSGKSTAIKSGLSVYVNRGALVAASWPKKRGRPKSPITREQNEWFRQANLLAKYATGDDQWMAIEISRGSPWYPRDILISAMAGRLFETLNIDGVEFRSMAVNEDVSSDLDFLAGTIPGTVIVRGPDMWQALVPGTEGDIFAASAAGSLPAYTSPHDLKILTWVSAVPKNAYAGSPTATKGVPFRAHEPFTVHNVGVTINGTSGHTYRGYVFELDGTGKITALKGETRDFTLTVTAVHDIDLELETPTLLENNLLYAICWGRRDGPDNFAMPIILSEGTSTIIGLPQQYFDPYNHIIPNARIEKAQPAVNDTLAIFETAGWVVTARITM